MSISETITRTDLTNILNEVLPSTYGIGLYKGAWTSSGTSSYGTRVTDELTLPMGLYAVEVTVPVPSATFMVGLHVGSESSTDKLMYGTSNDAYERSTYLCSVPTDGTKVAVYSEASGSVSYSSLDRGGIKAVQLIRYKETQDADVVVEQGTSGIWTYRKWNSGIAECWGEYDKSVTGVSMTAPFSGYNFDLGTIPFPTGLFNAKPVCTVSGRKNGNYTCVSYSNPSSTGISVEFQSSVSGTATCEAHIHAKGRWK